MVQEVCAQRLTADDMQRVLNTIYYPTQMFQHLGLAEADDAARAAFVPQTIRWPNILNDTRGLLAH